MFDIAWSELALIGAVALVVIGPKDLPKVMRTMGKWTRQVRAMAGDFQRHVDDMVRQAELDEIRKEAEATMKAADVGDIGASIEKAVDAQGIQEALAIDEAKIAAEVPILPEGTVPPIPPAPEGLAAEGAPAPVAAETTTSSAPPAPPGDSKS